MSKELSPTIIKLGGSVITYKSKTPPTTNRVIIHRIAQELASYNEPLILILGGGAHGHQAAHEHGFSTVSSNASSRTTGISHIRHNMTMLAHEVETALSATGVPSVVVPPFCTTVLRNGHITEYFTEAISNSLEAGLVVIVHGDVCFDLEQGALILSGDTLVSWLAMRYAARRILVGTDVDGVYDSDPRTNPDAALITRVDQSNMETIVQQTGPSMAVDVTGGMSKKLSELISLAKHGMEVVIFNLLVPNRLARLLRDEHTTCTRIEVT